MTTYIIHTEIEIDAESIEEVTEQIESVKNEIKDKSSIAWNLLDAVNIDEQ